MTEKMVDRRGEGNDDLPRHEHRPAPKEAPQKKKAAQTPMGSLRRLFESSEFASPGIDGTSSKSVDPSLTVQGNGTQ